MKTREYYVYSLVLILLLVWNTLSPAADVPFLSGRVTDDAEIISSGAVERISAKLKAHEEGTTNQVAVLTVPTLDGENNKCGMVKGF